MEPQLVLGFKEATSSEVFGEGNYKLVPWISWDDWNYVRESLFSSSPSSIDVALRRVSAWRSRGCLPVVIEVTAAIVETQQKDSYFRDGLSESDLLADDMLTMLYCMTIMRLVNGMVEKTRKKNEISIAEAANVIGIPRMLIDIRHECSHRDLPSLRLVRLASTKALDWLKAYYWEPQKSAIPFPSDKTANIRKEIKSKIRELAFSLDVKQTRRPGSSPVKGKRLKHLCGRSKFLSLMAVKIQSSKPSGSKKHINKMLKNLVKLYSSFPSEVISILLEFLLKELESADVAELPDDSGAYNTRLDDWKPLILKLSNKEPEMLLSILKTVVQMIETREALKDESGEYPKPEGKSRFHHTKHLSHLFEWLVANLNGLKPSSLNITSTGTFPSSKKRSLSKPSLVHLLHKCLVVSSLDNNNRLTTAASVLAKMTGNYTLVKKLEKLASLHKSNTDTFEETDCVDFESFYNHQENSIRQAGIKLENLKQKLSQKSNSKTQKKITRWAKVKSWNPCPIGMIPSDDGFSSILPVLDFVCDHEEDENSVEHNDKQEEKIGIGKREAECPVGVLDDCNVKKLKKDGECVDEEDGDFEGVRNRLMIGGVWKSVTEDELLNIALAVRILA